MCPDEKKPTLVYSTKNAVNQSINYIPEPFQTKIDIEEIPTIM